MAKKTKKENNKREKRTVITPSSSDNTKVLWVFDNVDKDGDFSFDIDREDFNHKLVLEKMMEYATMTWNEVNRQTHDKGKSKHHFISYDTLSKQAAFRIQAKHLTQDTDLIYSFALQNRLRIIGIRKNEKFHVLWYDPYHQVCPSKKKHT